MKVRLKITYLIFLSIILSNFSFAQINNSRSTSTSISLGFSCSELEIHPNEEEIQSGLGNRILISTTQDDEYHSEYQSADAQVEIAVYLSPDQEETEVFFEVIDPDLDDASPYETGTDPGDNLDTLVMEGILSASSDIAELEEIAGEEKAVARITLNITERYSGDNYKVRASLDPDFGSNSEIVETAVLVAWKRIYVEYDKMYRRGATLLAAYNDDTNTIDDIIEVDTTADFSVGDTIILFAIPGTPQTPVQTKITEVINPTELRVADQGGGFAFPGASGVKILGEEETFDIPVNLLDTAYGHDTDGSDGGTFVEFTFVDTGSESTPKVTKFSSSTFLTNYAILWRTNCDVMSGPNSCQNYIHLIAANDIFHPAIKGSTAAAANFSVLFEDNFINSNLNDSIPEAMAETLVHEFGHQFGLTVSDEYPVVHDTIPADMYPNHENTDQGVMTYDRNPNESVAEFFLDCIYFIRRQFDGI